MKQIRIGRRINSH